MKKSLTVLALSACLSWASALTLQGSVAGGAVGLGAGTRIAAVSLSQSGSAISELASAPLVSGKFSLTLSEAPPSRAQFALQPDSINWAGVAGGVNVSAAAQISDVGLFTYNDANGNAKRDDNEPLSDSVADVQRQPLVLVWSSAPSTVSAGRGFSASLKAGWNAFLVDMGKTANVKPYSGEALNLRVQ